MEKWLCEVWYTHTGEMIISIVMGSTALASWILTRFGRRRMNEPLKTIRCQKLDK